MTVHSMSKRRFLRVNDFGSVAYYLQQELWSAAYKRQSTCGSSTYQSGPGCMKTRLMGRGMSQWTMCRAPTSQKAVRDVLADQEEHSVKEERVPG